MSRIIGIIIGILFLNEKGMENETHRMYGGILIIALVLGFLLNKWVDNIFDN